MNARPITDSFNILGYVLKLCCFLRVGFVSFDTGNMKVGLSHIGGICDRMEVLGIPPQDVYISVLGVCIQAGPWLLVFF